MPNDELKAAGQMIIEGAEEALAVARGERPAAAIWQHGHRYIPDTHKPVPCYECGGPLDGPYCPTCRGSARLRSAPTYEQGVAAGLEMASGAQPSTAEDPNESAYQKGRFDGIMDYARAIRALADQHKPSPAADADSTRWQVTDALHSRMAEMAATLRSMNCPRPCNRRPDDFPIGECVDAGECGCGAHSALTPAEEPMP